MAGNYLYKTDWKIILILKKKKKVYFKNVIKKMRESNAAYQMVGYFFIDAKEAVDVILLISRPKFKFVVKYRLYLCI